MEAIIIFVILVFIVVGYAITANMIMDYQIATEAGDTAESDPDVLRSLSHKVRPVRFSYEGKTFYSKDFIRIEIHGTCMEKRGVKNGEQWLVAPLKDANEVRKTIQPKDILLIYLPDKDEYKIREFVKYETDKEDILETGSYKGECWKQSSKSHSISLIKGVVRYRIG